MDNDLISRQEAIDALDAICDRECEYPKKQRAVMCAACHLGSAFDVIDELPSAERRGRWISYEFGDEHWHKCSVCGTADEYINHLGLVAVRNYCPSCGARMEGEKE